MHGVDYRGEVHQEGITDGLDDVAVMRGHGLLDDLVMHISSCSVWASLLPSGG